MNKKILRRIRPIVLVALCAMPLLSLAATSDAALAQKVEHALTHDYHLQSAGIHVQVLHGIVKLTGTVASGVIVDQAKDAASRVPGVVEVDNELQVRGTSGS